MVQRRLRAVALPRDPVHQGGVHAPEPLERRALFGDVGHRVGGPLRLCRGDQRVGVTRGEEVAQGVGRRELPPQEAAEPPVGLQHRNVVQTVPTRGEQQPQRLDLLGLRVAARALSDRHVLGDRLVQPPGPQRLQHQRQPRPPRHRVRTLGPLHPVRQDPLAHRVARLPGRPPGWVPRRRARFTAVRALISPHARWYSAMRGATTASRSRPR